MASESVGCPVNMMIGALKPFLRNMRTASRPSRSGRPTSMITRSTWPDLAACTPLLPLSTATDSNSSCKASCSTIASRNSASSSTISILRVFVMAAISGNYPSSPREMARLLRGRPIGRPLVIDACPVSPCPIRKSYPDVMMVARTVGSCGGNGRTEASSHSGEPTVSAIFPKPAREAVGHEYRRDPFRVLEPELGRDAKLQRIAVARRQDLVGNLEGEKGLRVQRRRHVDAGVVSVGALKADIFRRQVRADALQEGPERDTGPLADHAPAFDANVPRHLRLLWQLIELWQRPRRPAADQAGQIELVVRAVDLGDLALTEIGVVTKVLDRLTFRVGRHQPPRIED